MLLTQAVQYKQARLIGEKILKDAGFEIGYIYRAKAQSDAISHTVTWPVKVGGPLAWMTYEGKVQAKIKVSPPVELPKMNRDVDIVAMLEVSITYKVHPYSPDVVTTRMYLIVPCSKGGFTTVIANKR